jgi:transcriptional regulator with XRE-family HTH domain
MEHAHPIQAFRERQDPPMSRKAFGALVGVGEPTVWRWETGARKIDDGILPIVVERTGIPAAELRPDLARLMEDQHDARPFDAPVEAE